MYFANRRLRCESSQEQRHELAKGKYLTIVTKVYAAAKVLQEAHYTAKCAGKDATELYFAISTSVSHYCTGYKLRTIHQARRRTLA
jgi:hypothetical protein